MTPGDGRPSLRGKRFTPPPVAAQSQERPTLAYARPSTGRRPWIARQWTSLRDEWGSVRELLGIVLLAALYIAYRLARVWLIYWFIHS